MLELEPRTYTVGNHYQLICNHNINRNNLSSLPLSLYISTTLEVPMPLTSPLEQNCDHRNYLKSLLLNLGTSEMMACLAFNFVVDVGDSCLLKENALKS